MVPYGPPDIKFSVQIPKSPFGDIENFTKLAHDPIPPYHSAVLGFTAKRPSKRLLPKLAQSLLELMLPMGPSNYTAVAFIRSQSAAPSILTTVFLLLAMVHMKEKTTGLLRILGALLGVWKDT